jgi:arginyl-tRNA synthetase
MKNVETAYQLLHSALKNVFLNNFQMEVSDSEIQIQKTRKEFEGDVTVVTFPWVKKLGKSPEAVGQAIGEGLQKEIAAIERFNVVKGFLNLHFNDSFWGNQFQNVTQLDNFGLAAANSKPRVMVEYASPNTNKPLHLGHLRNIFLGYSVSEIFKANGHSVTKVQVINDRGIHICKSMIAWLESGLNETPDSSGLKGDKLVGKYYVQYDKKFKAQVAELIASGLTKEEAEVQAPIAVGAREMLLKWENKDEETIALWSKMNGWVYDGFDVTYKTMGVDFDKLYYESDTYILGRDEVMKGLENGVFFKKEDGSIWIDLTGEGLDEKVVLRKDGTAMYITQDIGTAMLRFRDYPDASSLVYTVGNEQDYHFKVLFKILKKLGLEQAEKCFHLSYGMVELPEGKMKSREGTVVDADDIMAEMKQVAKEVAEEQGKLEGMSDDEKDHLHHIIGMSALKYFLLRVDPKKNMLFDPKESIDFNGNTGPFIQYGYVRTQAILRKVEGELSELNYTGELHGTERQLIKHLLDLPAAFDDATNTYNPSVLAAYTYELVREFNSFYQQCAILREPNNELRVFRLALTKQVGEVVKKTMNVLGIEMPERM